MKAIVWGVCPNCGGPITNSRLQAGLPCNDCLQLSTEDLINLLRIPKHDRIRIVGEILRERGKLAKYAEIVGLEERLEDFESFFISVSGKKLWSIQRTWARRLLRGENFAIIAPTGVGKTTFNIVYSLYHASRGGRVYIIVPTNVLLKQMEKLLEDFSSKMVEKPRILCIDTSARKNVRKDLERRLEEKDFDILVTTNNYLSRNFGKIADTRFTLIIVDDVDALLRKSKNMDRVLMLLGFTEDVIKKTYELVVSKINFYRLILLGENEDKINVLREKISGLRSEIEEYLSKTKIGQLIVASATGRSRGIKSKIFRELLGFEAGSVVEYLRNIVDLYKMPSSDYELEVLRLVKMLGKGGLIFVSSDLGINYAKRIVETLNKEGIRAGLASSNSRKFLEKFSREELDVLVGIASYYGVIVRGLDLPHIIRYAIFVGVPKYRIDLRKGILNPLRLISFLTVLSDCAEDCREELLKRAIKLKHIIEKLSYLELRVLGRALQKDYELQGFLERVRREFKEAAELVNSIISREDVKAKLLSNNNIICVESEGGKLSILSPDHMTYIQASGRTSRLFVNGMTKGLAIVLVDDWRIYNSMIQYLKYYIDGFDPKPFDAVNVEEILREIDEDRIIVKVGIEGKTPVIRDPVKSALLIVESPTKARTIASFFGKPSKRKINGVTVYEVLVGDNIVGTEDYMLTIVATRGHLIDLTLMDVGVYGVLVRDNMFIPIYSPLRKCRLCGTQFTEYDKCPKCGSQSIYMSDKIIEILRKLSQEADTVFIGTDPDVEGEKIAWDIYNLIAPYAKRVLRIEMHEITRRGVVEALMSPREIDEYLVEAQIVRRVEDRWIGFELSKRLWRAFNKHWLSAGRVQTPVLGWIIDRYRQWKENRRLFGMLEYEGNIKVKMNFPFNTSIKSVEEKCRFAKVIASTSMRDEISPPPPFTTETALYEASVKLGMSVPKTMRILQELFESGLITYHRTDSTRVSSTGMSIAKEYLSRKYNLTYYIGRKWASYGAHECIRPTRPLDREDLKRGIIEGSLRVAVKMNRDHFELYDLIFRRFIASQMRSALVIKRNIILEIDGRNVEANIVEKILEPGYLLLLPINTNPEVGKITAGMTLKLVKTFFWKGSLYPLYKQGELVMLMREKGIGRPSTYAQIIRKLLKHGYILSSKRGYLIPTKTGIEVYEFLKTNYNNMVSERRTRILEEKMRLIEAGVLSYIDALRELYYEFTIMSKIGVPKIVIKGEELGESAGS